MLVAVSMSNIYLARHGPSALVPRGWLSAAQFRQHLHDYDAAGLMEAARVPDRLIEVATRSDLIIHSPLLRATQTVGLIDAASESSRPRRSWAELVEAAQPAPDIRGLRLPLAGWDGLTRILWLLGLSGTVEPRQGAVTRARTVADRLAALSSSREGEYRTILVVGHGFQNVLIARELRRRGWQGPRLPSLRHGQPTAYRNHRHA
jgi:broad specificity phosphatase PhoE